MCSAAEDVFFPFARGEEDVLFDLLAMLSGEFAPEDWV